MTAIDISYDIERAKALGIEVRLSADDRAPADRRNPATACPTCDEGVRTITHPTRCAECTYERRVLR